MPGTVLGHRNETHGCPCPMELHAEQGNLEYGVMNQEMIVGGLSILNTVYNPSNDIERAGTCSWWERRLLAK